MTQKTLSSIIFTMIFTMASYAALAGGHTARTESDPISKEVKTTTAPGHSEAAKQAPVFPEEHSKAPHSSKAPQMEELPHVHKFHKERVKKIKKHHGKYWVLSQLVLALCHLSILVIGYLHATH